jgi:polysaccharide deacetylase 2 family uncharacterized protein YibQ
MQLTHYSGSSEWSALYVDGKLDRVGDHYTVDERISDLTGVTVVSSDDFLRGGNSREDVAQTLEDIETYAKSADATAAEAKAEGLREQARALLAEADRISS